MQQSSILVVDDDPQIIEIVRLYLEYENFQVSSASNGEEALQMVEERLPDLVLLDILMPKMDGKEVCRRLISLYSVPIVMLSCKDEQSDKIECLNMGADDYITKPFYEEEVVARVKAVLRRNQLKTAKSSPQYFKLNGLEIGFPCRQALVRGQAIQLTRVESRLLQELVINAGKVLAYDYLLKAIWGDEFKHEKEYLHVYIGRLRNRLEIDPSHPELITTVRGTGYVFKA